MSVREPERKEGRMEVQTLAAKLVSYTVAEASKEKVVSKRNRWSIGDRLVGSALDLATHIDVANSLNLDLPDEAERRRSEQDMAIAKAFSLRTLVYVAREQSHFDGDKHAYWTGLVDEVVKLIKAWRESDTRRKRNKIAE